ncbi:hypothetical protein G3M48_004465, partial [Beauveria asiatica]
MQQESVYTIAIHCIFDARNGMVQLLELVKVQTYKRSRPCTTPAEAVSCGLGKTVKGDQLRLGRTNLRLGRSGAKNGRKMMLDSATGDRDDTGIRGVELDWLATGDRDDAGIGGVELDWLATGDCDNTGIRSVKLDWLAVGIDWLATGDCDDTGIRGVELDWLASILTAFDFFAPLRPSL